MARRARRGRQGGRQGPGAMPKGLRPVVGGVVLVATVRVIDAMWRRVTGRPTPLEPTTDDAPDAGAGVAAPSAAPSVVRDRLVYAALLDGALRLARRMGLPKGTADEAERGRNGRSPA